MGSACTTLSRPFAASFSRSSRKLSGEASIAIAAENG
jgi:hypothetical protein